MIKSGYSKSHLNEDDADSWITVRGQRIPLNSDGEIIGGNPKVFGKKDEPSQSTKSKDKKEAPYEGESSKDKPKKSRDTEKFSPKRVEPKGDDKSVLSGLSDLANSAKEMLGHEDGVSDLVGEITNK